MPWESLVWVVPAGVAIAGIYRPFWGLLIFTASLPFFGSPPGGPYLAALDAAALTLIATSLRQPRPPRSVLTLPVLVFVLVALASLLPPLYAPPSWSPRGIVRLISTLHGVESWTVFYTWRATFDLVLGVGVFHAVRRCCWQRKPAAVGVAVAVGLVATAILGFLEQFEVLDLSSYRAIGQYVPPERMHSVFFNSGWLAEYFIVGAPFSTACLLVLGRRRAAAALVALSLPVVLLTQQRGAWIAALVQIVLLALAAGPQLLRDRDLRRRLAVTVAVLGILLTTMVVVSPKPRSAALGARLADPFSDVAGREALWQASLDLAPQRPLLGWGLGSFAPVYDSLHPPASAGARRPRGTAHNWFLNVLVETGGLGLAAFGLLVVATTIAIRHMRLRADSSQATLALGLALSLAGALVYGLVQYLPFLRVVHWLLWIVLATAVCVPSQPSGRWTRPTALAILALALASLPFRWLLLEYPILRGDRAYGLREPALSGDRTFQWTGPRAATTIAWTADCVRVQLANGHPAPQHQTNVTLRAADTSIELQPRAGWSEHILAIGDPRAPSVVVEVDARPHFRPFQDLPRHDIAPSRDVRLLGVAVSSLETVPCSAPRTSRVR